MDVLERVQGCNRIIVQGHMEIENGRAEGKRREREVLRAGRRWRTMPAHGPTAPRYRVKSVPP